MRIIAILIAIFTASAAVADPGHIAGAAGHDHWVAGAAIGVAVLIGIWGFLKGGKSEDEEASGEEAGEEEPQEA